MKRLNNSVRFYALAVGAGIWLHTASVAAQPKAASEAKASPDADSLEQQEQQEQQEQEQQEQQQETRRATAPKSDEELAHRLQKRSKVALARNKPEDARRLLRKAWTIHQAWEVAVDLGQVELRLHLPRDAAEHLEFAIRNAPPDLDAATLEDIRDDLAQAEAQVGTLTVRVDRPGAEVKVDWDAVALAPLAAPLFLEPGSHHIEAQESIDRVAREVTVEAGSSQELYLKLGPAKPAPSLFAQRQKPKIVPLAIGGGLVLAGAAVGTVFALAARNEADDARHLRTSIGDGLCGRTAPASQCARLKDSAEARTRDVNLSVLGFSVGALALAGTAAYWYLVSRPSEAGPPGASRGVRVLGSTSGRDAQLWVSGEF